MAKKSRRAKKRAKKTRRVPAGRPRQAALAPGPSVAEETETRAGVKAAQLAEEYRYVYSDLKRIGILAATMLAALIVLSLVIR